jgi:hypothetical protein
VSLRKRRRLGQLGARLRDSKELSDDDQNFLADLFDGIAHGADANEILGLTRAPGDKELNEKKRANFARLFHFMLCAMRPAPEGYGLRKGEAIEAASSLSRNEEWVSKRLGFSLKPPDPQCFDYTTFAQLHRAWYSDQYADLKKLVFNESDFDFPYY